MQELIAAKDGGQVQPRTADEVVAEANVVSVTELIKQVGTQMDTDKAAVSTAMLNTFIMAIDKIGGRRTFNTRDFMSFGVALVALDQVQPAATDYSGGRRDRASEAGLRGIADALDPPDGDELPEHLRRQNGAHHPDRQR